MSDDAPDQTAGEEPEEVGSLSEETARLIGALSGWARDQAGASADGMAGMAGHAAAAAGPLGDHLATGSAECTVCPICRTVHAVRRLSPEVRQHLAVAASSLAQAAAAVLATDPEQDPRAGHGHDHVDVEHIDVDG